MAEQVQPGFYTLTVVATSNTGYMTETITRSLIVRESSYKFNVSNLNPTYNGRTQGVSVSLDEFHFNGSDIDAAAAKSWTVKYYDKVTGKQVEPSQALSLIHIYPFFDPAVKTHAKPSFLPTA